MLRLWTSISESLLQQNQLTAYLSTNHVAISDKLNNLPGNNSNNQIDQLNGDAEAVWQQSCQYLDSLLESKKVKSGTQLKIVLGADLVRFLVLPPQQVMVNKQEKIAFANASFQEVYGANVSNWEVKIHDNAPNQPAIVAAIDKNLINSMNKITAKHQLKLNSLQPYVMMAFNESAKHFAKSNTYLAIVEANRLTFIFIQAGHYQQLRSHVIGVNWLADFKKILIRESAISQTSCRNILVYAPKFNDKFSDKSLVVDGWTIKSIDKFKTSPLLAVNNNHLKAAV